MNEPSLPPPEPLVRQFREILIWPLQLMPLGDGDRFRGHSELLSKAKGSLWKLDPDNLETDSGQSSESRYAELVYFLPFVRRFLYGVDDRTGASPVHVFRREDVASVEITLTKGSEPLRLAVDRLRLYFFEISIAILVVEISAEDLPLSKAQDVLDRFGRAYPPYWERSGAAGHCPARVAWKSADGKTLAVSDYDRREDYLEVVRTHRTPPVASHFAHLLSPLAPTWEDDAEIRYKQIEDERMPLMSYLTFDDPGTLGRADFVRLGFATPRGKKGALPYATSFLEKFEEGHCYDRFWDPEIDMEDTRYMCTTHAFTVVGRNDAFHSDAESGLLAHFRHHYFQLGLIAHLHKAALLMICDRLALAVARREALEADQRQDFHRDVRRIQQLLIQFTHRYWFHEVSNQIQPRELFELWSRHLRTRELHAKVVKEAHDITLYLDMEEQKKQTDTTVRLSAVATFGLTAGVAVGFLGMNIFDLTDASDWARAVVFLVVSVVSFVLTFSTVRVSRRLSSFLDAIANRDERR